MGDVWSEMPRVRMRCEVLGECCNVRSQEAFLCLSGPPLLPLGLACARRCSRSELAMPLVLLCEALRDVEQAAVEPTSHFNVDSSIEGDGEGAEARDGLTEEEWAVAVEALWCAAERLAYPTAGESPQLVGSVVQTFQARCTLQAHGVRA